MYKKLLIFKKSSNNLNLLKINHYKLINRIEAQYLLKSIILNYILLKSNNK